MKKYVLLYTFTAIMVAAILMSGQAMKNSVTRVTTVKVTPSTAEDTVTCTGKVESFPGNDVYATDPGVVQKIYVRVGEKVTAGQAIMDILPISSSSTTSSAAVPSYNSAYEAYAAYLSRSQSQSSAGAGETSSSDTQSSNFSSGSEAGSKIYTLKASNSGIVESLSPSSTGAYVGVEKPSAVIRNENGVQVRLSVDESQVSNLKEGQKVQISGVGFKNSVYTGSIESISSEAKQAISTTGQETVVEVIASVKKPGSDIRPGFTAKAKITTSQSNHILIVPYEAVREDSQENEFVFCVVNGRAKKVSIVTGREFDNGFEVKSGIRANDLVITDPDDVSEGAKIVSFGTAAGETHG
jgi:RND family efflux transporter MFP subunit